MYSQLFQSLGLSKNEAKIYESLLGEGELNSQEVARTTKINRRNVYDALYRLQEKGLVYEIIQRREHLFHAVDPKKLSELIQEKQQLLGDALPGLSKLYETKVSEQEVLVYRGMDGWKTYLRDILRVGENFYSIGSKAVWFNQRLVSLYPRFLQDLEQRGISHNHLFDNEVQKANEPIFSKLSGAYKVLPPKYSSISSVDVFGNHVAIASPVGVSELSKEVTLTVIINDLTAEAFRNWFRFIWDFLPGGG